MTHNEYMYDDELDPEVAALLDTVEHNPKDLQDLSVGTTVSLDEEDEKVGNSRTNSISDVDLSIRAFNQLQSFFHPHLILFLTTPIITKQHCGVKMNLLKNCIIF